MKKYRAIADTPLRAAPARDAASLLTVRRGTEFSGSVVAEDAFVETAELAAKPGFVDIFDALELPGAAPVPRPMRLDDDMTFCAMVTEAARHVGWLRGTGADRDYLLAIAYDASDGLKDMGNAESAGPFRFTAAAWEKAITEGPARGMGQTRENRLDWNHQPDVAAALAAEAAERFRQAFDRAPSFPELFFLQTVGDGGIEALARPRDEPCRDAIPGTPAPGSAAASLKGGTLTVRQALDKVEERLVAAYAQALPIIDRQPPEIRLVRPAGEEPPWLRIAREEMTRGVAEQPGEANEERISRYHEVAGVKDKRDETPWCGSFVAFCLKTCGAGAAGASVPPSPALALSWEGWGRTAPDPAPLGSIVVLRFTTGGQHVGFLVGRPNADHLRILGGNQGDPGQVSEVHFRVAEVSAIRWLDMAGAPAPVEIVTTTDPRPGDALFLEKAPGIMKRLMRDLPPLNLIQAAAILGNIGHECGGFRFLHQIGMPEGLGGHGWCQWDGSRRLAFLAFAKAMGRDWREDEPNYAFLVHELRGPKASEATAFASLVKQATLEAAVEDFDRRFERSGVRALDRRLRYAKLALGAMGG